MATPTWQEREQPILEAIFELEERGEHGDANVETVAAMVALEPSVVRRSMKSLVDARFIEARSAPWAESTDPRYRAPRLLERGRREVGQWPPGVAEAFLQQLDSLIANASDPDERRRLKRVRASAADVAKGVLSGVIVSAGQWAAGG